MRSMFTKAQYLEKKFFKCLNKFNLFVKLIHLRLFISSITTKVREYLINQTFFTGRNFQIYEEPS